MCRRLLCVCFLSFSKQCEGAEKKSKKSKKSKRAAARGGVAQLEDLDPEELDNVDRCCLPLSVSTLHANNF